MVTLKFSVRFHLKKRFKGSLNIANEGSDGRTTSWLQFKEQPKEAGVPRL